MEFDASIYMNYEILCIKEDEITNQIKTCEIKISNTFSTSIMCKKIILTLVDTDLKILGVFIGADITLPQHDSVILTLINSENRYILEESFAQIHCIYSIEYSVAGIEGHLVFSNEAFQTEVVDE